MRFASFDGTEIAFHDDDDGHGGPVVLIHGFAADTNLNWARSGVLDALVDEGYRTIAVDLRGHGLSSKPHDAAAYADDALSRDVQALFDHLELDGVCVVGYSMGAAIALRLGAVDSRVDAVVLLGVGAATLERGTEDRSAVGDAFLVDDPETIADPIAREFRRLADSVRADRAALSACMAMARPQVGDYADAVDVPVLVVAGADDELAGDPAALAARIPGARSLTVRGNHFTANSQPALHAALLEFLAALGRS